MRRMLATVCLALFVSQILVGVNAQDAPDLRISELLPDPDGGREFIEIWNAGTASQDMTGWSISDAAGNSYTFAGTTVAAGQRIVVWGGGAATPEGPAWSKATVWNNGGDTASLLDPAGTVIDVLTYGPGGEPVPTIGMSLAWDEAWVEGNPTPGRAPGELGGHATATVQDVPPRINLLDVPTHPAPGPLFIRVEVADDNGPEDVAQWTLHKDDQQVAQGMDAGTFEVNLTVPAQGSFTLVALAMDQAGNEANATQVATVAAPALQIVMPPTGIHFPELVPGATDIVASAPFTLYNNGTAAANPRIDVSDLRGPQNLAMAGNLSIGIGAQGAQAWMPYHGPLTSLPALGAGESVEVWLRLDSLPVPLAAGDYGTSFTVVP